jgi:hypothetical protein
MFKITEWYYDPQSNKTWVNVQTDGFAQWLWISGQCKQSEIRGLLRHTVNRMLAEVA